MRCSSGWVVVAALAIGGRAWAQVPEGTGEVAERLTREALAREAHDEAARAALEAAELAYQRHAIRFCGERAEGGRMLSVSGAICEGEQEIGEERFYRQVGRDDLAERYHRRRLAGLTSLVVAGTVLVAGAVTMAADHGQGSVTDLGIGLLGGGIAIGTATLVVSHVIEPIGKGEAGSLVDAYNRQLRQRLGLPGSVRAPAVSELRVAPYAAERGGGFVFGGRF